MRNEVKKIDLSKIRMKGIMLTESELADVSGGSNSCNCPQRKNNKSYEALDH